MSLSPVAFILPVQFVRDDKSFKAPLFTESLSNRTPRPGRFHELQTPCWQMGSDWLFDGRRGWGCRGIAAEEEGTGFFELGGHVGYQWEQHSVFFCCIVISVLVMKF